jgi:hypothetical protein
MRGQRRSVTPLSKARKAQTPSPSRIHAIAATLAAVLAFRFHVGLVMLVAIMAALGIVIRLASGA